MATWNGSESPEASSSSGTLCHVSLQVKLGLPLHETLHNNRLPCQLVEMLAYIAHEGVTTTDIFRRPGSTTDLAVILTDLTAGRLVNFTDYNFYTLASLTKKFLLKLPGGVFGPEVEDELLEVLNLNRRLLKYEAINSIITKLPIATQQLTSLLLGTFFRIVNHSEYNTMSSDAVAKSVAHCLFHSVANDPPRLQLALQLLQILIDDFTVVNMLGAKNIQYFADVTRTRVSVQEKRHSQTRASTLLEETGAVDVLFLIIILLTWYELGIWRILLGHQMLGVVEFTADSLTSDNQFCNPTWNRSVKQRSSLRQPDTVVEICPPTPSPPLVPCSPSSSSCRDAAVIEWNQPWLNQQASMSAPDINKTSASPSHDFLSVGASYISSSLSRFDNVKRRQMLRMKRRSHWFLSPNDSHRLELRPHGTTASPSQPVTLTGTSVQTGDKDRSKTMPDRVLPDTDETAVAAVLSSQQIFLIPHLEVTSPHDDNDDSQPLENHLRNATERVSSSSSELSPASFAQVAESSSDSNTVVVVVGRDCANEMD